MGDAIAVDVEFTAHVLKCNKLVRVVHAVKNIMEIYGTPAVNKNKLAAQKKADAVKQLLLEWKVGSDDLPDVVQAFYKQKLKYQ